MRDLAVKTAAEPKLLVVVPGYSFVDIELCLRSDVQAPLHRFEGVLAAIHALEEDVLELERKYGVRSETLYAEYWAGEESEDDASVLDFSEWGGVYRALLERSRLSATLSCPSTSQSPDPK